MKREGLPTGEGTAPTDRDVADPHPSDEAHYDRKEKPGGTNPPCNDIGPNPYKHDGTPRPKPDYGKGR